MTYVPEIPAKAEEREGGGFADPHNWPQNLILYTVTQSGKFGELWLEIA